MAQVPVTNGPTVGPSSAPTPTSGINAPAEAFGASVIGQGAQTLGKAAGQTSDVLQNYANTYQALNNKVAADTGFTKYVPAADSLWADFKQNNMGVDPQTGQAKAVQNLPQLYSQLDDLRKGFSDGMSPVAQAEYDANTRRYMASVQGQAANYGAEQHKAAIVNSSAAVVATQQSIGASADDGSDEQNNAVASIAHQVAFQQQQLGWTDDQAHAELNKAVGAIFESRVKQSIDAGNIPAAQAIFSAHKTDMTLEQIDAVAGSLKVGGQAYVAQGFAQAFANGEVPSDTRGTASIAGNASFLGALHGREGVGQNPGSSAVGQDQFTKGTLLQVMKSDPQFSSVIAGKSDAQILALRSDPVLMDKVTLAYAAQNTPILQAAKVDPNAANLGMAHAYGPQGAISILQAAPNTPIENIIGADTAAKNRVAGMTTGQVANQFNSRFGLSQVDLSGAQAKPPVGLVAPPPIRPNEDPEQIRADYDSAIVTDAHILYGDNPVLEQQAIQAARTRISVNIQQVQANQNAAANRLSDVIEQGGPGGVRPLDQASLFKSYPGAAADYAALPPSKAQAIDKDLNIANSPFGAYVTPTETKNAQTLQGMYVADPAGFGGVDLWKYDLGASDRKTFMGLQRQDARNAQAQQERTTRLNTYLSDPVVASIVKTNFPQKTGPDYLSFIGALDGRITAMHQGDTKPPTPEQIRTVATSLIGTHGGIPGVGWFGTKNTAVPPDAAAAITAKYQSLYKRDPSPDELSFAFQRGPSYYGR